MRAIYLFVVLISLSSNAKVCTKWGKPQTIGKLNHNLVEEASGIVKSDYNDRLYHINDSGDGPYFYQTKLNGADTKKIEIEGFVPRDVESMAYGSCGDKKCIIIADVGDNKKKRKTVSFVIITEQEKFPVKIKAKNIITAKYPKTAHNVEGVAMHPNGNIYILTKNLDKKNNRAAPAHIFILEKGQWQGPKTQEVITLKHLGQLDIPYHLYEYSEWGRIITGFDIHPDGKKLLINTYKVAMEINLDLTQNKIQDMRKLEAGKDFTIIPLLPLMQIESISYLDKNSFIYTTEYHEEYGSSPLIKMSCTQ